MMRCPKCKLDKPINEFPPSSRKGNYCKSCKLQWARENPNHKWRRMNRNKERQKERDAVFVHYGEQCVCCGETERRFLTLDHVDNDGAAHRRSANGPRGKGGSAFYAWLVRSKFPSGLQTMCYNCNCGRARNGGVCPHHDTEGSTTRAAARSTERCEARGILGMGL